MTHVLSPDVKPEAVDGTPAIFPTDPTRKSEEI